MIVLRISVTVLLATLSVFNLAGAAAHPFEFHADARMRTENNATFAKSYGYMNVFTNSYGNGIINVMFSNGSPLNRARFNAQVRFLNATGEVVKVEKFTCWVDPAELVQETECKVSKPLRTTRFDTIEVDFYLSDISTLNTAVSLE